MTLSAYIQNELMRRLSPKRIRSLAKSVGLDPNQPLPDIAKPLPDGLEFTGHVDFEVTIGAFGHLTTTLCRTSFTASLMDGRDPDTGKRLRVLDELQQVLHLLVPTGLDNPIFEWLSFSHHVLSSAAIAQLDEQVETLVRVMELTRPIAR